MNYWEEKTHLKTTLMRESSCWWRQRTNSRKSIRHSLHWDMFRNKTTMTLTPKTLFRTMCHLKVLSTVQRIIIRQIMWNMVFHPMLTWRELYSLIILNCLLWKTRGSIRKELSVWSRKSLVTSKISMWIVRAVSIVKWGNVTCKTYLWDIMRSLEQDNLMSIMIQWQRNIKSQSNNKLCLWFSYSLNKTLNYNELSSTA
jgi:hypothetical protein